jgi:hypothetical protein
MIKRRSEMRNIRGLTQSQVENVIERTTNNSQAAEYLKITRHTWKKYASLYYHRVHTDMTLYEYHRNLSYKEKGVPKYEYTNKNGKYKLEDILEGKHPEYTVNNLKRRLLNNNIFPEQCNYCGYDERRMSDYTVPLLLHYKDNNLTNHRKENLEFLCYNCFYIMVDTIRTVQRCHVVNDDAYLNK